MSIAEFHRSELLGCVAEHFVNHPSDTIARWEYSREELMELGAGPRRVEVIFRVLPAGDASIFAETFAGTTYAETT